MRYSPDQAARIIQRAVRNRRSRKTPAVLDEMRRAELQIIKEKHRERLEAKEREYLFLSKLPADAVLKLYLRKQHQAAIVIQAFWRGRAARRKIKNIRKVEPPAKVEKIRTYKLPPDSFYSKISEERHAGLVKRVRLKGNGDLEEYKEKYSKFLSKQVAWEKLRQQRRGDRLEIQRIIKALIESKSLNKNLNYFVENPTGEELLKARKIHKSKIVDPKKWWMNLDWDDDIEAVGSNILEQIQEYKLNLYRERRLEFAKF
jgi:hypothetical protein